MNLELMRPEDLLRTSENKYEPEAIAGIPANGYGGIFNYFTKILVSR